MDSKFYWVLNNLIALLNLTDCGDRYNIFSLDFVDKRIGVGGAKRLAQDLGIEDRLIYKPACSIDKHELVEFDYHGITIFDLVTKREDGKSMFIVSKKEAN